MGIKAKVVKAAFAVAFGMMAVAGCGYRFASDGLSAHDTTSPTIHVPAMKAAALSSQVVFPQGEKGRQTHPDVMLSQDHVWEGSLLNGCRHQS